MRAALRRILEERLSAPKKRAKAQKGFGQRTTLEFPALLRAGSVCGQAFQACRDYTDTEYTVYFVRCGEFVKIGYTSHLVEDKIKSLAAASPHDFEILRKTAGGVKLEKRLHRLFKAQHYRGEWFRFEGDLRNFLGLEFSYTLANTKKTRITTTLSIMNGIMGQL
jgi:hypothetical protein